MQAQHLQFLCTAVAPVSQSDAYCANFYTLVQNPLMHLRRSGTARNTALFASNLRAQDVSRGRAGKNKIEIRSNGVCLYTAILLRVIDIQTPMGPSLPASARASRQSSGWQLHGRLQLYELAAVAAIIHYLELLVTRNSPRKNLHLRVAPTWPSKKIHACSPTLFFSLSLCIIMSCGLTCVIAVDIYDYEYTVYIIRIFEFY